MTTTLAVTTSMKILVSKPDLVCCNSSYFVLFIYLFIYLKEDCCNSPWKYKEIHCDNDSKKINTIIPNGPDNIYYLYIAVHTLDSTHQVLLW